jgi:hypothetical protein
MIYVTQVCWELASKIMMESVPFWSSSQAPSKPVLRIPLLCVQWKSPDDGQSNCPKHVEFHSKNKFEKIVHIVGVILQHCASYRFATYMRVSLIVVVVVVLMLLLLEHIYIRLILNTVTESGQGLWHTPLNRHSPTFRNESPTDVTIMLSHKK